MTGFSINRILGSEYDEIISPVESVDPSLTIRNSKFGNVWERMLSMDFLKNPAPFSTLIITLTFGGLVISDESTGSVTLVGWLG